MQCNLNRIFEAQIKMNLLTLFRFIVVLHLCVHATNFTQCFLCSLSSSISSTLEYCTRSVETPSLINYLVNRISFVNMQHGEIFMLREVSEELSNRTIRVTGLVRSLDIHNRTCVLYHKEDSLVVDASLVDLSILHSESLCQIIGVLKPGHEKVRSIEQTLHNMANLTFWRYCILCAV